MRGERSRGSYRCPSAGSRSRPAGWPEQVGPTPPGNARFEAAWPELFTRGRSSWMDAKPTPPTYIDREFRRHYHAGDSGIGNKGLHPAPPSSACCSAWCAACAKCRPGCVSHWFRTGEASQLQYVKDLRFPAILAVHGVSCQQTHRQSRVFRYGSTRTGARAAADHHSVLQQQLLAFAQEDMTSIASSGCA